MRGCCPTVGPPRNLRQQILSGRLKPGERLPPLRLLQQQYQIAGMTARAALRVLSAEGLVDVVPGHGSFVADPLPRPREPVSGETADDTRILALEDTPRDVLGHIRPQGNPNWALNTCLIRGVGGLVRSSQGAG
ncbi:winged helix-turn-helix domain-containing protein [Streptomyces sp. PanSC9]|uniref:winged helix-turn-helix domain-containing protein n=1 Tax=Streptomyces sp. PanSC9 TaxID=1520461 RepID=UPI000F4721D7|nr:winged helix-turn-helix domain-containing protein [Streptomyces sp. PanSC9]